MCSPWCARLAGSTMWTSDSSHTCPSPETNAILMMVQTVVRLGTMATACCLKDIQLWCGVCEGRQSEETWLYVKVAFIWKCTQPDTAVAICNNTHWWLYTETIWGQCFQWKLIHDCEWVICLTTCHKHRLWPFKVYVERHLLSNNILVKIRCIRHIMCHTR